jgi:FKBP-type peptidyl-prolyl cis-trans isomerase SlpA
MSHPSVVQPDSYLTLHYRVALSAQDGSAPAVVDTFAERPATLQLGSGQFAHALEALMVGMESGQQASFELPPGLAFGPRNPELLQRLSRTAFDAETDPQARYEPGDWVEILSPEGENGDHPLRFAGVLKELNDTFALIDFNHPLAGQAIRFEVKIIGIL